MKYPNKLLLGLYLILVMLAMFAYGIFFGILFGSKGFIAVLIIGIVLFFYILIKYVLLGDKKQ